MHAYLIGKVVKQMKTYKITRVYIVQAQSKQEAVRLVADAQAASELLDAEFVREVAPEKPAGFGALLKNQIFGYPKNSSRHRR